LAKTTHIFLDILQAIRVFKSMQQNIFNVVCFVTFFTAYFQAP